MPIHAPQIHRTTGRLRVRSPHLKKNRVQALHVQSRLAELHGVRSVQLNSLTGSLLIHFDPSGNTSESLLEVVLSASGPLAAHPAARVAVNTRPRYSQATRKVAKVACVYAGEKVFEHLVGILIAAVL